MKNNIRIANETLRIIKTGSYNTGGKTIKLISGDYSEVKVYSPDKIYEIVNRKNDDSGDLFSASDNAKKVAGYFKEIFIDEHYSKYFENVVFAILSGKRKDKLKAFSAAFGNN